MVEMFHRGGTEKNEEADPESSLLEGDRLIGFFPTFFCVIGLEEHCVEEECKKTQDEKQLHKKDGQILRMVLDPATGLCGNELIHIVEIDATGKQQDDEQYTCDFLVMLIERIGDRLDLLLGHCLLQPGSHSHDEERDSTNPNDCCCQVHPMIEDWNQRIEVCNETYKCVHRPVGERQGRELTVRGGPPISDSSVLIFYVEIEDRGIVAESFLAEFFHQLNRNKRDVIFPGVLFNTFLHHGAQEVGNPVQSCL